ncbi:MAG TPA: methyltransferase domain-containing protein [Candidatus Paceibacterota bacterium]|nr:methyltransferase domain-containing protein [Candidatus Paceibacterota bacterium]
METGFLHPTDALNAAHVHEGMIVADLGAGSGFFTRAAARIVGEGGQVWAVDTNQDMLPRLKNLGEAEGLHNIEVMKGDIETVGGSNLPAGHFDFCILTNVLFCAENKTAAVGEVKRLLKTGGRALVIDWTDSFGGLGPHPGHVIEEATARELFENAGLAFVQAVPAGSYHWGFIVRKKAE